MNVVLKNVHRILVFFTSVFAFTVWNLLNRVVLIINFNTVMDMVITYIIGIGLSYSFYILLNSLLVYFCDKFKIIKKLLFKKGYLDGIWGGAFFYNEEYRIVIININQTTQSISIRGKAYSLNGKILGTMESESVDFDGIRQKLWASYNVESSFRSYQMNGLANMQYELNAKEIPFSIEGYAYQTMVNLKCKMIFYKMPSKVFNKKLSANSIESDLIECIKQEYLEKIKKLLPADS